MTDVHSVPDEQKDFRVEDDKRKRVATQFLKISLLGWLFVVGLFGLMIYFSYDTRLVLNTKVVEVKDPVSGLVSNQTLIKYAPNDFVPNSDFSNSELFVLFAYGVGVVVFLISRSSAQKRLLRLDEVLEISDKYVKFLRDKWKHKDVVEYNVGPMAKLKTRTIGEGEPTNWEWVIGAEIKMRAGLFEYYVIGVHPYEGHITRFLKVDHRLHQLDACPNCGTEYDVKIITQSEFARMIALTRGRRYDSGQ